MFVSNKSLLKGLSAVDTKTALVAPLDQSTSKKNDIQNFRPVFASKFITKFRPENFQTKFSEELLKN